MINITEIALENDLDLNRFDAEQAFVPLKLDTDVYLMRNRYGDISGKPVLKTFSCGLKQAAHISHDLLVSTFSIHVCEQHPSEPKMWRLEYSDSDVVNIMVRSETIAIRSVLGHEVRC